MSEALEFLQLYKELEYLIKKKYNYQDFSVQKAASNELSRYKSELDTLRNVRNILAHSKPFGTEYIVEPHKNLIKVLKRIIEDIDDELLIKKCTKIENLVYAKIDDNVLSFLNKMEKHIYSHAPILDNGVVKGVISENILFSYFVKTKNQGGTISINSYTKFDDLINYFSLESATKEEYIFMKKNDHIDDALIAYKDAYNLRNKRIGMIFVTENGCKDEKLIGIITAYDLLGKNELFFV